MQCTSNALRGQTMWNNIKGIDTHTQREEPESGKREHAKIISDN